MGSNPISVAIGDLNGDGKPDLAVANYTGDTVAVLLNTTGLGPPVDKDQCKDGGWNRFDAPKKFKNQGDCIEFVNTGK